MFGDKAPASPPRPPVLIPDPYEKVFGGHASGGGSLVLHVLCRWLDKELKFFEIPIYGTKK